MLHARCGADDRDVRVHHPIHVLHYPVVGLHELVREAERVRRSALDLHIAGQHVLQVLCGRHERGAIPAAQAPGHQDRIAARIAHAGQDLDCVLESLDAHRRVVRRGAIRGHDLVAVTGRVEEGVGAVRVHVHRGDELRDALVAGGREALGKVLEDTQIVVDECAPVHAGHRLIKLRLVLDGRGVCRREG